jgi:hypothetical protein
MMLNLGHTAAVVAVAELVEAFRVISIVSAPEAAHDPVALWGLLPLGLPPKETLDALRDAPAMPDPERLEEMILLARERHRMAVVMARRHFKLDHLETEDVARH